jgi:hypothetical protein
MKPYLLVICFLLRLTCSASAQTLIKAIDASKYIGEKVFACDTIYSIEHTSDSNLTLLTLGRNQSNPKLTIVVKGFTPDPDNYSKGSNVCVVGLVTSQDGKPKIEVTDPGMISAHESHLIGSDGHGSDTILEITKVQLMPPPHAQYFGERYRAISLMDLDKEKSDTIKITEKIRSYKLTNDSARIDFGGIYPNQKLTIILKEDAKKYLDAMLEFEYKSNDPSHILKGKKFIAIGKVTHFKSQPQIVINNPGLFAIIQD